MPRQSPFKHHRFPRDMILCAVRWYLRYPLSYQDVVDLLAERGVTVDRSTVYRWVQKFGPELTKRTPVGGLSGKSIIAMTRISTASGTLTGNSETT